MSCGAAKTAPTASTSAKIFPAASSALASMVIVPTLFLVTVMFSFRECLHFPDFKSRFQRAVSHPNNYLLGRWGLFPYSLRILENSLTLVLESDISRTIRIYIDCWNFNKNALLKYAENGIPVRNLKIRYSFHNIVFQKLQLISNFSITVHKLCKTRCVFIFQYNWENHF